MKISRTIKLSIILLLSLFIGIIFSRKNYLERHLSAFKCQYQNLGDEARFNCYEKLIYKILQKEGLKDAFNFFEELRNRDKFFVTACHKQAHFLGELSYWRYQENGEIKVDDKIRTCSSGFYHGFMQEFGHHGENYLEKVTTLCDYLVGQESKENQEKGMEQCYHGIGHGLIFHYIDKLGLKEDVLANASIADCETIAPKGENKSLDCVYGAVAGVASLYFGIHGYLLPIDYTDPFWFCKRLDEAYIKGCYENMIPSIWIDLENDFDKTFSVISKIEDPEASRESLYYLATIAMKHDLAKGAFSEQPLLLCRKLLKEEALICTKEITKTIRNYSIPKEAEENVIKFCNLSLLTEKERGVCLNEAKYVEKI